MSSDSELEFTNTNKNKNKSKKSYIPAPSNSKNKVKSKRTKGSRWDVVPPSTAETGISTTNNGQVTPGIMISDSGNIALESASTSAMEEIGTSSSEEDEVDDSASEDGDGAYGYGKLALGIDPSEVSSYDGKSKPINGSQYLLSVMNEKRVTPKIAVAGSDSIYNKAKNVNTSVTYLDRFEKEVNFPPAIADETQEDKYIPSQAWRNNNLQDFSLLRSKVERWRELLLKGVTRLKTASIKLPAVGNKVVWQKFCFGVGFEDLVQSRQAAGTAALTVNKIVDDYFSDSRGRGRTDSIIKLNNDCAADESPLSPGSITTTSHAASVSSDLNESEPDTAAGDTSIQQGYQPLMSVMLMLTQQQIEFLIYFQSDWIFQHGFVNKCQGEWLYALLACIDKPVDPSTMGDIRNICKSLINIRNKFCMKLKQTGVLLCDDDNIDKLSDDFMKEVTLDEKSEDISTQAEEYLSALNLFIFLISDYFCQKDLVGCM